MQKDRSIILMDELSNFEVSIVKKRVNVAKSAKPVKNILKYKRWQIIQALGELRYYRLAANINRFNFKQTISALPKCTINDLYWKLYGAKK
jgi:hypothetical protein